MHLSPTRNKLIYFRFDFRIYLSLDFQAIINSFRWNTFPIFETICSCVWRYEVSLILNLFELLQDLQSTNIQKLNGSDQAFCICFIFCRNTILIKVIWLLCWIYKLGCSVHMIYWTLNYKDRTNSDLKCHFQIKMIMFCCDGVKL